MPEPRPGLGVNKIQIPKVIPENSENAERHLKMNFLKNIKKSGKKPNLGQSRGEFEMIKTEFQENLSRLANNDTK